MERGGRERGGKKIWRNCEEVFKGRVRGICRENEGYFEGEWGYLEGE